MFEKNKHKSKHNYGGEKVDLIKILSEGRKEGLKDEEISRQVAETVLEEVRQMSLEDFVGCFTSAAFNRKTNAYDIVLSFRI